MKTKIIFLAIIIFLLFSSILVVEKSKIFSNSKQGEIATNSDMALVGGDRDDHDCIASAGYSWCQAKEKCLRIFEEFCPDSVEKLVKSLEEQTGVEFSLVGNAKFRWLISRNKNLSDIEIFGVQYQALNVVGSDYDKIEIYFYNNYQVDNNNTADGATGGLRGFNLDYMVCTLGFDYINLENVPNQPVKLLNNNSNVILNCGYFNENDVSNSVIEQSIREQLATKYQKNLDEINIKINKKEENQVAGSVTFSEEGIASGGLFLAINKNDVWQVVYDGNGSIDCNKMRQEYGFSDYILSPNFCD